MKKVVEQYTWNGRARTKIIKKDDQTLLQRYLRNQCICIRDLQAPPSFEFWISSLPMKTFEMTHLKKFSHAGMSNEPF